LWALFLSGFFFQAEDGIRDFHVTGVQTCALPILSVPEDDYLQLEVTATDQNGRILTRGTEHEDTRYLIFCADKRGGNVHLEFRRSEERRVGKECRARAARHRRKKKSKKLLYRSCY